MKKLTYAFIVLMCFCKYSQAQSSKSGLGTDLFFVSYEVASPTNSNYLTNTSWSGARFEYRRMVRPNISLGIAVSFNAFDQYFNTQTYQYKGGNGAITGDMIRQVYTSPLTASLHYYFEGTKIKPYIGIGLGTEYSEQDIYFNIYNAKVDNWGFVMRPEFGLLGKFSDYVGGFISVSYNYATNSSDSFNIDHLTHVPVNIGVFFSH
jgi:outer membrane protein W